MTGTVLAQAVPVLIAPVLTRLYTPEQFGIFSLLVGIVSICSVVVTARYELAIVLPDNDEEAVHILALAMMLALLMSVFLTFVILIGNAGWGDRVGSAEVLTWLHIVPPMVLLLSIGQALNYWANRHKRYSAISVASVGQQLTAAITSIGLGAGHLGGNGLIVGRLLSYAATGVILGRFAGAELRFLLRRITRQKLAACARKYRQFPIYNVPYSLIGTFSREFMVIGLTSFSYLGAAGFYGLARSVLYAPIGFLSSSLGQVFYREAAESIGTPQFEKLTVRLMNWIALTLTPAFLLFIFWAPEIFSLVFGARWKEAGVYAAAYAPAGFLFFFTSWPERIYEVAQKQHVSLTIQVVFDSLSIALVWGLLQLGFRPLACIFAYSAVQCGYHLAYLFAIFRIAGFQTRQYWRLIGNLLGIATLVGVMLYTVKSAVTLPPLQFMIGAFLITVFYIGQWLFRRAQTTRDNSEVI